MMTSKKWNALPPDASVFVLKVFLVRYIDIVMNDIIFETNRVQEPLISGCGTVFGRLPLEAIGDRSKDRQIPDRGELSSDSVEEIQDFTFRYS